MIARRPPPAFSVRRIGAMALRYFYVLRGSWPRLLELAYWPLVQMILWGFITSFFTQHSSWVAQAAGVFISAVLLWDVLFRSSLGMSYTFVEEMWARNLAQLFISPLRPIELVAGLMTISFARTLISILPAALLALPLFDVWVFGMGPPLLVFFANLLVAGWALGLVIAALILRFGLSAESLCWVGIFMMAPLSGIYYPVDSLPGWIQPISWMLPTSHVFEGMRSVLFGHGFRLDLLARAVGLNLVYLSLAALFYVRTIEVARERGLLLQQGE
ncbi:MAG: ABC transporter permease [Magnetospiraceae bacterium]